MEERREPRWLPGGAPIDQGLVVDSGARVAYLAGREVGLTPSEFALLAHLVDRPGVAIADRDLLEAIWGTPWHGDTTPLQVHISRLRRKLGESGSRPRYVSTVRGFGYRFDPSPEPPPELPMSMADLAALDTAAATSDLMYCLTDTDGVVQWVSESAARLCGGEAEDLVGDGIFTLVHPDDADILAEAVAGLLEGRTRRFIARFARPPVPYLTLSCLARPLLGPDRRISGFLGELATLEGGIPTPDPSVGRQSEATPHFREPLVPLELVYGSDLRLRSVSPRVRFCGWDPQDVLGTVFSPAGGDEATLRALIEQYGRMGIRQLAQELPLLFADGERRTRRFTVLLTFDDGGVFTEMRALLELLPEDYA